MSIAPFAFATRLSFRHPREYSSRKSQATRSDYHDYLISAREITTRARDRENIIRENARRTPCQRWRRGEEGPQERARKAMRSRRDAYSGGKYVTGRLREDRGPEIPITERRGNLLECQ